MKKLFLTLALALTIMLTANNKLEAVEISFGFSGPGIGFNVLRGDTANAMKDLADQNDADKVSLSLSPVFQLNLMFEISPFLALETGLGFGGSVLYYTTPKLGFLEDGTEIYAKAGFTIPIMLRLQHELERALIYLSVGPKFIIPILNADYAFRTFSYASIVDEMTIYKSNDFGLDIGFALGGEIRILDANYLGLRVEYDLNVVSMAKAPRGDDDFEFYHDNFGFSLTYRYAFGSKWKDKKSPKTI